MMFFTETFVLCGKKYDGTQQTWDHLLFHMLQAEFLTFFLFVGDVRFGPIFEKFGRIRPIHFRNGCDLLIQ